MNPEVTERPILFSTAMVRAILRPEHPKTQTRRVITPRLLKAFEGIGQEYWYHWSPYGEVGNRLWVRETYNPGLAPERSRADGYRGCVYRADDPTARYSGGWTASIHMPRRHSRLTLEITELRVERLQDICEGDARAEGIEPNWLGDLQGWDPHEHGYLPIDWRRADPDDEDFGHYTAREAFARSWDVINARRGFPWSTNPLVWVISFRRIEP